MKLLPTRASALGALLPLLPAISSAPARATPRFHDVTEASGLEFEHRTGFDGHHWFPEIVAGGAGIADFDGDGRNDVVLIDGGRLPDGPPGEHVVFRNVGEGRFEPAARLPGAAYGQGVAIGDFDGDGDPDLYVTNVGPNQLFRNDGGFRFVDRSAEAGAADPGWSTSAAFGDLDGDGDLDLYVANYCQWSAAAQKPCRSARGEPDYCHPSAYAAAPDSYWRNRGDGTFEDATAEKGFDRAYGHGLGVVIADLDRNGRPDVFVANDGDANLWWRQDGTGAFAEDGLLSGLAFNGVGMAEASMGVAVADLGADGDWDLLLTHMTGETNTLLRNDGDGFFTDATDAAGLGAASVISTGFGASFQDFDRDGDDDLLIANGAVIRGDATGEWPYEQPDAVYENEAGVFRLLSADESGLRTHGVGRGVACGDLDGDGDVDAVLVNAGSRARVLRNDSAPAGHWLGVSLREDAPNPEAIGAVVSVRDATRSRPVRRVARDGSFLSAGESRVTFGGLGAGPIEVAVSWPDGATEVFATETDRDVTLRRGEGAASGEVAEAASTPSAEIATVAVAPASLAPAREVPPLPDLSSVDAGVRDRVRDAWSALAEHPESGDAWKDWGVALFADAEDFAGAGAALARSLELTPGNPRAAYLLAVCAERIGDPATRRSALERTLALAPDYLPAALRGIELDAEEGRLHEAAERAATLEAVAGAEAAILLARACRLSGRQAEATAAAERAVAAAPDSRRAWWELGLARRAAGDPAGAAEALARAEALPVSDRGDPWLAELTAGRGGDAGVLASAHQARRAGDLARSLSLFEDYVRRQPTDPVGWTNVAAARRDAGDLPAALDALAESLARDSTRAETHALLGSVLLQSGRSGEALAEFDAAIARDSTLADAHRDRAALLEAAGRRDDALASLRTFTRLRPADVDGWVRLAEALLRAGDLASASTALDRALALDAADPVANFRAGGLALAAQDAAAAASRFEAALAARPDWAEASFGLGLACRLGGDRARARAALRRATELAPSNERFRTVLTELEGE